MADLMRGTSDWRSQVMMAAVGFLAVVLVDIVVLRVAALVLSGALLFIAGSLRQNQAFGRDLQELFDGSGVDIGQRCAVCGRLADSDITANVDGVTHRLCERCVAAALEFYLQYPDKFSPGGVGDG
jgi:hypothetical protein